MIDIVITDDRKLFAQGLTKILSKTGEFYVKATLNDDRSTVKTADIGIIDLNTPHFDGQSTIKN